MTPLHALFAHIQTGLLGRLDGILIGRLLLTLVLSGVVGLERSTHERASGLRTHILVGLGACLITMAGAYGFTEFRAASLADRDPFRLATYVVSGIGFLGAGAILRHGATVRGLTTAASVWNVAGVGIAIGSGLGSLAAVSVLLMLFVLVPLQKWESRLRIGSAPSDLTIHLRDEGKAVGRTLARLSALNISVRRATVVPGAGTTVLLRVELGRPLRANEAPTLVRQLLESPDVERVDTALPSVEPGARKEGGRRTGRKKRRLAASKKTVGTTVSSRAVSAWPPSGFGEPVPESLATGIQESADPIRDADPPTTIPPARD